jgi:hypothetical protein
MKGRLRGMETSGWELRRETRVGLTRIFGKGKRLNNHAGDFMPWRTGSDRAVALDPDGQGLGGAAANQQFRMPS